MRGLIYKAIRPFIEYIYGNGGKLTEAEMEGFIAMIIIALMSFAVMAAVAINAAVLDRKQKKAELDEYFAYFESGPKQRKIDYSFAPPEKEPERKGRRR